MTENARLLLVEDERNVGSTLVERLSQENFNAVWARSATEAREQIHAQAFDLALLDVGLPDGSGFELAALLRKSRPSTAIVFLTAYGAPEDRVRGLELGAEDYIVKPFHFKELLLRVQNALKRARYFSGISGAADEQKIGRATILFSKFEAVVDGKSHALTHKECALLRMLVERRGKTVSRDEILNEIWSRDEYPTSRTIDNFILRLRRLIEEDPENPRWIKSIRGVGYQLVEHP